MGFAPRVLPDWMLNARHERSANELLPISYYTVILQEPGFPRYFLCPACNNVHCDPENPHNAFAQDPGEASQIFKLKFEAMAEWEYLDNAQFLALVNSNG